MLDMGEDTIVTAKQVRQSWEMLELMLFFVKK